MTTSAARKKQIREATAKRRQARRDAGQVPKERWADPEDWPEIDHLILELERKRGRMHA